MGEGWALCVQVLRDLPISFGGTTNIFAKAKQPISIEFHKLGLLVGEKRVLNAVSGLFAHSRLIAVMGPSGAPACQGLHPYETEGAWASG